MNSIESQFVPYEIAVKLKKLGFDWECLCYFENKRIEFCIQGCEQSVIYVSNKHEEVVAPLYSQAFDWFRVEHGLSVVIPFNGAEHWYWWITETKLYGLDINSTDLDPFNTYESARLACLEKLIELVTEKKG